MKNRKSPPSTVPKSKPPKRPAVAALRRRVPGSPLPRRPPPRQPTPRPPKQVLPKREVARIIDGGDRTLVDVLDSLLNQGVVLNADLVLALADVDLVYVRLSALLCAADRVLPRRDQ
jgi:hypothetical protein